MYHNVHQLNLLPLSGCVMQEDLAMLEEVIQENDGSHDMVVLLLLGLCGDASCRDILCTLYPHTQPDWYTQRAQHLLRATLQSPRRLHQDGDMFIITCLAESCQHQDSGRVAQSIVSPFNSLNLIGTTVHLITPVPLYSFYVTYNHMMQSVSFACIQP